MSNTAKRDRALSAREGRATPAKVVKTSDKADVSAAAEEQPVQRRSDGAQVTVESYFADEEDDEEDDFPRWAKHISGVVNVGQHEVAGCDAKLIRRGPIRNAFWYHMEALCEESSSLAFELFDRYGRLNREYDEHEIRKGSGVWGRELDHDDILIIEIIDVEPRWRRQGMGTKLLSAILDKARQESKGTSAKHLCAFVSPMYLTQEPDSDAEELDLGTISEQEQVENFTHFFRSLGFRRVGNSRWLAFTDDDSHPSRRLDKSQDWDAPVKQLKGEQITPELLRTVLSSLRDRSISGAECVSIMREVFAVEANAPLQLYADENGNTILHMATMCRKAEPISFIMSKVPQITEKRNSDGWTALEALQSSLEQQRTQGAGDWMRIIADDMSDNFTGFRQPDIECLAALTGTEIFDLHELSDEDLWAVSSVTDAGSSGVREFNPIHNTLRLKCGCTCGQCIGGFLSPRMQFALHYQAVFQYDTQNDYPGADCRGTEWVDLNHQFLTHVPEAVQENLTTSKSMRQGFINMCQHIASCLEKKRLPNTATILDFYRDEVSEWPPVTRDYLEGGGTVAAVAMMIFDRAIAEDEWAGDGSMMETFKNDVNRLPSCRNDHEFGFVRAMCGY
ncbi:hypothetical protein F5Y14DRAFT_444878 [Nemania sp. NC0429]|nr:hypothetical protein F5Y14DRAFT_444878 [Nemania sp. NC0429]